MVKDQTKQDVMNIANKAVEFQNNPNIKVSWKGKGKNAEYFGIEIKSEQVKLIELGLKGLTWFIVAALLYFMIKQYA